MYNCVCTHIERERDYQRSDTHCCFFWKSFFVVESIGEITAKSPYETYLKRRARKKWTYIADKCKTSEDTLLQAPISEQPRTKSRSPQDYADTL